MQAQRLVLYPRDPGRAPHDTGQILAKLQGIGLIDGPWRGDRHLAGPRFLELIAFVGCSPQVRLKPDDDASIQVPGFCHLQIPQPTPEPRFLYAANTKTPHCPACREAMSGWRASLRRHGEETLLRCGGCGSGWQSSALAWRRSACTARSTIHVWDIFEGEARPTPALLEQLATLGAGPWDFCYLRD